jgi:pyruvate/2-oxoglutarate dehydrogenase complex dihydrolipoamide acyltransferase (E2) component
LVSHTKAIAIIVEDKEDIAKFANYSPEAAKVETKAPEPAQPAQAEPQEKEKAVTTADEGEKEKAVTTGVQRELKTGAQTPNVTLGEGADRVLYSPLAKRLALDNGLELFALRG